MMEAAASFGEFLAFWFKDGGWVVFSLMAFLGFAIHKLMSEWFDSMDEQEEN